ncbi:hypothetical protein [Methanobrevibacter sp.]|uniref:hypothetical protein n=1 Tax=Methanobrevibacter sp. TaxID=66852 RepID=UPI00260D763A|nr:hypothetical protein [uncultured Methanobrevibacter sp.]
MKNRNLAILIILVIIVFAGVIGGLFYMFNSSLNSLVSVSSEFDTLADSAMKNETFGDVKISVPENITFRLSNDSTESSVPRGYESDIGIYILIYSDYITKDNINYMTQSYVEANNLSEIKLNGLSANAKAYKSPYGTIDVIVTNDEGNKVVILTVPVSDILAVKMANSVTFT